MLATVLGHDWLADPTSSFFNLAFVAQNHVKTVLALNITSNMLFRHMTSESNVLLLAARAAEHISGLLFSPVRIY